MRTGAAMAPIMQPATLAEGCSDMGTPCLAGQRSPRSARNETVEPRLPAWVGHSTHGHHVHPCQASLGIISSSANAFLTPKPSTEDPPEALRT